ncbi:MAG: molecular chaperone HtpG, partial [Oscillospiraceae bacterium]|nr:molecular chaperone HtpG [Oscillospiraceae bacterium]
SKRLLDLMINSIYTHQEIFLRELISNTSDAIDKLAYLALTDENVGLNRSDFAIWLKTDEENGFLTVSDNGIGMNKEELEENLGTIAQSGSLKFKKELENTDDVDIIGQFGVGFYSAFMVAEAVTVISKKYGEEQAYMWQSSGADGYTITPCEKESAGTDVILKLKKDTEDEQYSRFLKSYELQNLVRKYSDYIRYPIKMEVQRQRVKETPEGEEKPETPEYETYTEVETLNSMVPLWQRAKKDVKQEEYNAFYRDKFFDFEEPLSVIHTSVEGTVTYKAMLFLPQKAPFDFYTKEFKKGLQLYSSGVMIMENCADLLPDYFRFVRGVVDSQDLSLNISREMLQHDRQLKLIAANLEKKIKAELERLRDKEREKYEKFFASFGLQLKYGVVGDYGAHKDAVQGLLLFWSSKQEKFVTLKEYVEAMPEGQKYIYYAAGENRGRLRNLPQADLLREKGYDFLLFTDEVDGFIPQTLRKYMEKEFRNLAQDELGLDEGEKPETTELDKPVLDFVKEALGEKVKEVRTSTSLGSHPVCVVPDAEMSFEMEKYLKRVNPEFRYENGRVLELNTTHPVFAALRSAMENDKDKAKKYAELLYAQALLIADLPLDDPTAYTDLVCELMQ